MGGKQFKADFKMQLVSGLLAVACGLLVLLISPPPLVVLLYELWGAWFVFGVCAAAVLFVVMASLVFAYLASHPRSKITP